MGRIAYALQGFAKVAQLSLRNGVTTLMGDLEALPELVSPIVLSIDLP